MKHIYNNLNAKNNQNLAPSGVVIVDNSLGGAALYAKLCALPIGIVYLNVMGASSAKEANSFVKSQLFAVGDLSGFVAVLPAQCPNSRMVTSTFPQLSSICVQPPLYQARQYSATRVAVLSATNSRYQDATTVDGRQLVQMIADCAPQRQIRTQMEKDLQAAAGCDAVAFDDCIFGTQKHNFWSVAPNVKFFDCTDSVASIFYKNKKLRQKSDCSSFSAQFCDKSGKIEKNFNKILQKIYKPY